MKTRLQKIKKNGYFQVLKQRKENKTIFWSLKKCKWVTIANSPEFDSEKEADEYINDNS